MKCKKKKGLDTKGVTEWRKQLKSVEKGREGESQVVKKDLEEKKRELPR